MIIQLPKKTIIYALSYVGIFIVFAFLAYIADDRLGLYKIHKKPAANAQVFITDLDYIELPRMNLTLASAKNGKSGYVSLDLSLEVEKSYAAKLAGYQPVITDQLIAFTRKLDVDTLRDTSNEQMLRSELLEEIKRLRLPIPVLNIVIRRLVIL